MFDRIKLLVLDKFSDIENKNILIVGIGGVGSYVVESLVRSGIQNITLIDNDIIEISNLNRQLMTDQHNIGKLKVEVMKQRVLDINPNCTVNVLSEFLNEENIDDIITDCYDYVVDACDSFSTKVSIIKRCNELNIKLITSCGAGNKMDPTKLEITDIYKTSYDPLAKRIRKECKKLKIKKLVVVASREKPVRKIQNSIPSNSFVPAVAGCFIASYIIKDIVGDLYV